MQPSREEGLTESGFLYHKTMIFDWLNDGTQVVSYNRLHHILVIRTMALCVLPQPEAELNTAVTLIE